MVLHSDNCCYTYIRPILHAMRQDDMITYIQVYALPVDIRYHDMVAALICIIPLTRKPGSLHYT